MTLCKLCESAQVEVVLEKDHYPLCGTPVVSAESIASVEYTSLQIGLCLRCAYVTLVAPPPETASRLIYDRDYISASPCALGTASLSDERVLQLLEFLPAAPGDVRAKALEIGSYDGAFLLELRRRGWDVTGCEPNPIGQEATRRWGIGIIQEYFREDLYPPETFDLVVARYVLEHVPDPVGFLRAAWTSLKPGGHIVVEVPNDEINIKDRVLSTFVPEHVSYFGVDTLRRALDRSGFSDQEFATYRGGLLGRARRRSMAVAGGRGEVRRPVVEAVDSVRRYGEDVARTMAGLRQIVDHLQAEGRRLAVYGANSQTYDCLAEGGLSESQIAYIVDDDPLRLGLCVLGTRIETLSSDRLRSDHVAVVLISAHFSQEKLVEKVRRLTGGRARPLTIYPEPALREPV